MQHNKLTVSNAQKRGLAKIFAFVFVVMFTLHWIC